MNKGDKIFELIGWIRILISPLLAGFIIGAIVYLIYPDQNGIIAAVAISLAGLITGILWANSKLKGKGTIHFVSRVMATPELDKDADTK
ncbi:MAG: hypothetical protein IPN36_17095 [Bacteroidetes bacterium]|jgi:hypothetical protein|nr:hypothetical protein [Bacteroidota bacterium]MBK9402485.1 hypothetical protein [Bacteroidota bacterium]